MTVCIGKNDAYNCTYKRQLSYIINHLINNNLVLFNTSIYLFYIDSIPNLYYYCCYYDNHLELWYKTNVRTLFKLIKENNIM